MIRVKEGTVTEEDTIIVSILLEDPGHYHLSEMIVEIIIIRIAEIIRNEKNIMDEAKQIRQRKKLRENFLK
jgi:hypothetical protein